MGAGPLRGQVPLTALGPDDVLSAVPRCVLIRSEMGGMFGAPKKMALRNGFHWGGGGVFFWNQESSNEAHFGSVTNGLGW